MQRINWIDWAKALAVISIVFCHLPQSQEWFYFRYLQACTITIFIFISGYLKKDRSSDKENWKKYWHSLIQPYIIYNVLVYPYWLVKYYILHGEIPDLFSALKPIIGAILFEHESSFAEPLNGPLWYLPAILFMHITIDFCRKTRYLHHIMIGLCILSFFLYAANKHWLFLPQLTPMGIFRRLPYYYIGYVIGRQHIFRDNHPKYVFIRFLILFCLSILLFHWHLQLLYKGDMTHLFSTDYLWHIALFYPTNLCFLFSVLYFCKVLNCVKSKIVTTLSIGTIVIIGLHYPLINAVNFIVNHLFDFEESICYHWHTALSLALFITALLYPIINYAKKKLPFLNGGKK